MGLFNFFKKGSATEDVGGLEVKGTAYDTTAKALPPIRGTLPVQGNGPNTLDELQRSARLRSDAGLTSNHSPAPSNRVSRLRSMSLGRPSTAPGGGSLPGSDPNSRPKSSSGRTPRDPSKAPSLGAPRRKPGPPYLLGVVGPGDTDDNNDKNGFDDQLSSADAPPPVPPIADYFKHAPLSPGLISLRSTARSDRGAAGANDSISGPVTSTGGNTTKTAGGYVDLLDAQGAFRPSDFKTRVKASGVRDYGEDVADRNMGVNGVDLNSPAVMAFYALTGGEALVYKSDGSAMDVHGNRYTPGNIPSHLRSQSGVGQDENVARANQSMRVPRFPTRTTSLEPREELARVLSRGQSKNTVDDKSGAMEGRFDTAAARRRMSVHGSALTSSTPQPKARPLSMHPIGFSDFKSDEEAASVPDIPRTRAIPNGESPGDRSPRTQSRARDSVFVTKKQQESSSSTRPRSRSTKSTRSNTKPKHHDTDSEESEATGRPRSRSSATKRRKGKARADESSLSSYLLGGDDAIPPLPSSALSSSRPGSSGRHDSRPQSQRSWKAPSIGQLSTTSTTTASHTDAANQSNSRPSSSSSHPRNRSIGGSSTHGRTQLHDITEYIPNRRSSLSISSIPSSSLSSNPFPSSQSRHTADTSLDLGYSLPMKPDTTPSSDRRGHFRGKGSNITVASSIRTGGYHDQRADAPSIYQHQAANATPTADNYDDDMTTTTDGSDIDSYLEKRRRKRPDDEGLLFREGAYGTMGGGLPGLFGDEEIDGNGMLSSNTRGAAPAPMWPASLRHPPSKSVTSRPRTAGSSLLSSNAPPPIPSWDFNLPKLPKTSISSSKYQYHPHADHDDSSSITVSESEAGRTSQAGSSVYANETGILSGSSAYDEMEKEMDDQLDMKLAIRLRREMKRRERALTTSAARPKSVENPRAWDKYEQGNMADAEV